VAGLEAAVRNDGDFGRVGMKNCFCWFQDLGCETRHWIGQGHGTSRKFEPVGDYGEMKVDARKTCATIDMIGTLLVIRQDPTRHG
jgi:hypothetical protein